MSADNLIRVRRKANGLYQVRHESASSLIHALNDIEPTEDELLLSIIADDVDGLDKAVEKAEAFEQECEEEGYPVEYGIEIESR
jgi:hypothetical protein